MKRNLIHIVLTGKSALGWDDDNYRVVFARQTGKSVLQATDL